MNYFTLRALSAEWNDMLNSAVVLDAWSQSANELSFALEQGEEQHTIRIHCDPKLPLLFRSDGYGRARKNTATLFEEVHGLAITGIRAAERDRLVFIDMEDDSAIQILLFGSRPNVFWVQGGEVRNSFLMTDSLLGTPAPSPRAAPDVDTFELFQERWRVDRKTLVQAVSATVPLLGRQLAEEVVERSELQQQASPSDLGTEGLERLFVAAKQLRVELDTPKPIVYWRGSFAEAFSLFPLQSAADEWRAESFETVDAAIGVYAKRSLAQRRFMEVYKPVETALAKARRKAKSSADAMLTELENPSRADIYEAWGHLLMAQAVDQPAGQDAITLPDILNDGESVVIKLDPALTAVENAQRFYAKARQTRAARTHAEDRWEGVHTQASQADALLNQLRALEHYSDMEAFLRDKKTELARFTRPGTMGEERLPYRLFQVQGWEIRVGKNAKSNASLTTKHSGPHDLWLHARGVPGSHVVIRRPNKTAEVPKSITEVAAQIAAHFSDAKSQPLAPVIVTERKYVRPVKGGPPGLVRVDREDVVMVEPGLPSA